MFIVWRELGTFGAMLVVKVMSQAVFVGCGKITQLTVENSLRFGMAYICVMLLYVTFQIRAIS